MTRDMGSLGDARLLRRAIEAARQELPSEQSVARTLKVLGVTTATLSASAVLAHAATQKAAWSLAAKLLITGAFLGVIGVGAWAIGWRSSPVQHSSQPAAAVSVTEVTTEQAQQVASTQSSAQLAEPAPITPESLPLVAPRGAAASAPTPARSVDEPKVSSADRLAAEVRALDEVRKALASHNSASALSLLDRYQVEFPRPVLGGEALVLRIEAMAQAGDRAGAKRLAEQYLKSWPSSPLASKVRSLAGLPSGD